MTAADTNGAAGKTKAAALVTAEDETISSDAVNMALQRTAHTHDLRRVVRKDRIYGGVDIVLSDENGDGEGNCNQDGDHRAQQGATEGGT